MPSEPNSTKRSAASTRAPDTAPGADPAPGVDTKELVAPVNGAGVAVVFLRVFSSDALPARYSVVADLSPLFSCFPDGLEPNNNLTLSSSIATSGPLTPITGTPAAAAGLDASIR